MKSKIEILNALAVLKEENCFENLLYEYRYGDLEYGEVILLIKEAMDEHAKQMCIEQRKMCANYLGTDILTSSECLLAPLATDKL